MNVVLAIAQTENSMLSTIKKEVDKNFTRLKSDESVPPFFISYAVIDQYKMYVKASFGTITKSEEKHIGWGMPTLYVGNYLVNNERMDAYTHSSAIENVSLDPDSEDIGVSIKKALDNRYKVAVTAYNKKRGMLSEMNKESRKMVLPDFEKTPPVSLSPSFEEINTDRDYWKEYARTASAIAEKYPEIEMSDVTVEIDNGMAYYYNTEGSQYAIPIVICNLSFVTKLTADDGGTLQDCVSFLRSSTDRLPDIETFTAECEKKIIHLLELKKAP